MTTTTAKKCFICKETKPLDQFAKNKAKKDGHRSECIACRTYELRTRNARKRARTVGSAADLTIRQMRDLMSFSTSCIYCGTDLSDVPVQDVTVDHLVPTSRKGDSALGNLAITCKKCNLSKGDKPAALFTEQTAPLVRFISMESGISREEAAIILATDALEYCGIENAGLIATIWIILESVGFDPAACAHAPTEMLVELIQNIFAYRYSFQFTDPADIEDIRTAVQAFKEFEAQPGGGSE
jgi:5-methylcytosine-specific restriction endonuclease McrA